MRTMIALGLALAAAVCAGCTGMHVRQLSKPTKEATDQADNAAEGIRYYQAAPYLLAHPDGKGGVTTKLIYLPDLNRLMSASPYSYLASNTTHMKFTNGILTEGQRIGDATAVPKAAIAAAEKALAAVMAAANTGEDGSPMPTEAPTPRLFRLRVVGDKVHLEGGNTEDHADADMPTLKVQFEEGS